MDPVHFSGKEILEMAIRIEENGLAFYKAASANAKNEEMQTLFNFFIIEEVKHVELFSALKDALGEGENYNYNDPFLEEEGVYLNALADSSIFIQGTEAIENTAKIDSDAEAVDFAIQIEKDSILFYLELLNMVRDEDRKLVRDILNEERQHITKLSELKLSLQ